SHAGVDAVGVGRGAPRRAGGTAPALRGAADRGMKIFVTGAAGYIGSVVTDTLVESGHTVVAFDNLSHGHRDAVHPGATFVAGDLLDRTRLIELLRGQGYDAVVHLAAEALIDASIRDPGL